MVVLFRVKCNDKNERNACEQRTTLIEIWFEQHAAGIFEELASRFVMKFVHIRMKTNEKKKTITEVRLHCGKLKNSLFKYEYKKKQYEREKNWRRNVICGGVSAYVADWNTIC